MQKAAGQNALFGETEAAPLRARAAPWPESERLRREFDAVGFFLSGHPLEVYDAALKPLGITCLSVDECSLGYGKEAAGFWLYAAERPAPDDPKSGLHFCFTAPSRESVAAFHKAAMTHGGRDNGKPGVRKDYGPNYYAAFVHDPEGYRLEAYYGGK